MLLGISTDTLATQEKFVQKENLTYPLLADPTKKVTAEYGVLGTRGLANRVTFVIDQKGVLRKIYTGVKPAGHPAEVLDFIKEHLTDKK